MLETAVNIQLTRSGPYGDICKLLITLERCQRPRSSQQAQFQHSNSRRVSWSRHRYLSVFHVLECLPGECNQGAPFWHRRLLKLQQSIQAVHWSGHPSTALQREHRAHHDQSVVKKRSGQLFHALLLLDAGRNIGIVVVSHTQRPVQHMFCHRQKGSTIYYHYYWMRNVPPLQTNRCAPMASVRFTIAQPGGKKFSHHCAVCLIDGCSFSFACTSVSSFLFSSLWNASLFSWTTTTKLWVPKINLCRSVSPPAAGTSLHLVSH